VGLEDLTQPYKTVFKVGLNNVRSPTHPHANILSVELDIYKWSNNNLITSDTIDLINFIRIGYNTFYKLGV